MRFTKLSCRLLFLSLLLLAASARGGEYEKLAALVTRPLYSSFDESVKGHSNEQVILRTELARQKMALPASDPELKDVAKGILAKLNACQASMERIRELDKTEPDYSGIARSAINAGPALVRRDPETNQLLADDQAAVNDLVA